MLEHMNFRMLLFVKIKRWLVSMTEDVRSGHGHGSVMKDMDKEKKKKMLEKKKKKKKSSWLQRTKLLLRY